MAAPVNSNATLEQAGSVASLKGKVALVTGAESGIGQGVSIALARAGAFVVVTGRSEQGGSVSQRAAGMLKGRAAEAGSETVRQIEDAGGKGEYAKLDIAIEDDWVRVMTHVEKTHGRLDVLVNNAGAGTTSANSIYDTDIDNVRRMINLNTEGCFMGITHGWAMLKKAKGVIFNVNTSGLFHGGGLFAYSASKHGMFGVTQAAAIDGRPFGIRAISLNPGGTWTGGMARSRKITEEEFLKQYGTGSNPLKRPAYPADFGAAVVFLSSPAAKHISGIHWYIDGGSHAR